MYNLEMTIYGKEGTPIVVGLSRSYNYLFHDERSINTFIGRAKKAVKEYLPHNYVDFKWSKVHYSQTEYNEGVLNEDLCRLVENYGGVE